MNQNSILSLQVKELIAIGASIGGNCLPCLRYHFAEARKLNVSVKEIKEAIEIGKMIKERPINDIYKLADDLISREKDESI
jgi:4-carboxymuconolactone decarboxylase